MSVISNQQCERKFRDASCGATASSPSTWSRSQEGYQSFAAGYAKEALSTLHKHLETAQALTAAATTGKR
jgi:hypothetical protein